MRRFALVAQFALLVACGGHAPPAKSPGFNASRVVRTPGHPAIVTLERHGDPSGALALVIDTSGADARGSAAIGLAAVVKQRLSDRAVRVTAQSDAIRVEMLIDTPTAAKTFVDAARAALVTPVDDNAWNAAKHALDASPTQADDAERSVQTCLGVASRDGSLTKDELETARTKVVGTAAIVMGLVAQDPSAMMGAISNGSAWPTGTRKACENEPPKQIVYLLNDGRTASRIDVQSWSAPDSALDGATQLASTASPLSLKLRAFEPSAHATEVSTVVHPRGGCLDVHVDTTIRDSQTLARLAALASDEVDRTQMASVMPADPRDAATTLAMEELARGCSYGKSSVVVGVRAPSDMTTTVDTTAQDALMRTQLDSAAHAWATPALETHAIVEPGQADAMVLIASTCGTRVEDTSTSGATVVVTNRLARHASDSYGVTAEPFVTFDAAGVLVRAHAREGEDLRALGQRLAQAAARTFAVDSPVFAVDPPPAPADAALGLLATTLAADHATWIEPRAVFARLSQTTLDARLNAIRHGPIRAVVLANADRAQADAMTRTLDRYVLRGDTRACAADVHVDAPKPGTYAVRQPGASEAYVALPVSPDCATSLGSLLRGEAGMLARALVGIVRSSDARVIETPNGAYLVVHLDAPGSALDASVAQTRALFERMQSGAISADDVKSSQMSLDLALRTRMLDPRERVTLAWHGAPSESTASLDSVRACAQKTLHDDALVIVAARSTMSAP